jgi:hypothetical protein
LDKAMPSGTVNMAELADFAWDELYIFGPYTSQDEIAVALGRPWSDTSISHRDDITLLLFVRRGQPYAYLNYSRMAGDFVPVARLTPYTREEAVFSTRLEDNRYIVEQDKEGEAGR